MASKSGRDLVERIYDAPLAPHLWPGLLAEISDRIGGTSAWLSRLDVRTGNGTGITARIDPAMPMLYTQYYGSINPIAKVENPRRFIACWRPIILTDEDRISKDQHMKSEFYNDFQRPQDIHSTLMIRLAAEGTVTSVVNIHRNERQGRFERSEIDGLKHLHGHLIQAFRLTERLEAAEALTRDLSSGLERLADAVFVLDSNGRLRHANGAGRQLIGGRGRLRLSSGRLRARHHDEDRLLQALIGTAASPDLRRGGSMHLSSREGDAPLLLTTAPLQPERLSVFHDGPAVLIYVGSIPACTADRETVLMEALGLSRAEVRVASALLDGQTPAEAAAALHLSIHTVRTHLARVFAKTGTHRQSELMRVMMRTIGPAS